MSSEIRKCVNCGNDYEAFLKEDGTEIGSGRCDGCRSMHLATALKESLTVKKPALDPAKNGTAWIEPAVCKKCGADFDAKYFNVMGMKYGNPRGLCPEHEHEYLADLAEKEKAEKERQIKVKREAWRYECGIPGEYLTKGFAGWEFGRPGNVDAMYQICYEYATNYNYLEPRKNKSLLIASPRVWGIGKTHLASSIAHRILSRWHGEEIGRPVTMVTEPDLFDRLRASFNHEDHEHEHETEQKIINITTKTPLLIIDDLGKEQVADPRFVQRTLFKIINGRYNYGLPVVITANKTGVELRNYLGGIDGDEATLDRLIGMCGGEFHEFTGESYRRK